MSYDYDRNKQATTAEDDIEAVRELLGQLEAPENAVPKAILAIRRAFSAALYKDALDSVRALELAQKSLANLVPDLKAALKRLDRLDRQERSKPEPKVVMEKLVKVDPRSGTHWYKQELSNGEVRTFSIPGPD
jgi:uncharacterized membrane protein YccC